jgi:hypothetical protein
VSLRFTAAESGVIYEDVFGEFDMRVLAADLLEAPMTAEIATALPLGWGGDRFRVYQSADGPALVWYVVWDDDLSRTRFLNGTAQRLESRRRLGYRLVVTSLSVSRQPATRVVLAPEHWPGWGHLPTVEAQR